MLGRVTSLDWLAGTSLMPMWFVVIGYASDALGIRTALVVAGLAGGLTTLVFPLLVPGVHDPEPSTVAPSRGRAAGDSLPAESSSSSESSENAPDRSCVMPQAAPRGPRDRGFSLRAG